MKKQNIIHLESVDSTNNYIANCIKEGALPDNTVILADYQTKGKGQRNTNWNSKIGENLLFSMYKIWTNFEISDIKFLNQSVSYAIIGLLKLYNIESEIKWPNDIYVGDKKIAGVLIENQFRGNFITTSIIGIGLNVNEINDAEINDRTSLIDLLGKKTEIIEIAEKLISQLKILFENILNRNFTEIENNYLTSLYKYKIEAKYCDSEGEFFGIIEGTDTFGKLIIKKSADQKLHYYDIKEVKFL